MELEKKFREFIQTEKLFRKEDDLLIAVSGGVDSVVLCDLCASAGFKFFIAHCNFQLREKESDADEIFVKELAARYKVKFFSKKFDTATYAEENKLSIQVAARNLRYEWFNEIIKDLSINSEKTVKQILLTAHHADDNIETMLMNFFKGSGINGLKSIVPKQQHLVRPLLFAFKNDIVEYANKKKLAYREDASNASDKYTRNYFRNQLIPGIEKVFPEVRNNLLDNAERFREIQDLYLDSVERTKKKMLLYKNEEVHIPVLKLLNTTSLHTIIFEIFKDYGFQSSQAGEVIKLLHADSGKYIKSHSHRILKNRKWLIISALKTEQNNYVLIDENNNDINFSGGKLFLENKQQPVKMSDRAHIAFIDKKMLGFPLLLRKYKTGDYFYPFGLYKPSGQPSKKKLSRFFMDKKLSLIEKENVWVIESNKKIVWVVGHRIDERFAIKPSTKNVLKITLVAN
ncbi:MAG: tRNA lysidine(34) synthetase TilS [Ferruginibacter sp.]